jgi:hypothetical protein
MDLYLRKSDHGQLGPEIYRVILKDDGDEVEIGSISDSALGRRGVLLEMGHRYRHAYAGAPDARPRRRPRRLHAEVQGGVGQVRG